MADESLNNDDAPYVYLSKNDINILHDMALQAAGDHPSYREGYLDAYNRAKALQRLVKQEVTPKWCTCKNRDWDGDYTNPTCKNCGGTFD